MNELRRPPGHLCKTEVADLLGVCEKTLDRRRKAENVLQRCLKAGRRYWFPTEDVDAFVRLTRERGRV